MMIEKMHEMGVRSDHVYTAAVASIGLSVVVWLMSRKTESAGRARADRWGIFVGQWPPTLFGLGNALHQYERE